jgi:hypothetical protein
MLVNKKAHIFMSAPYAFFFLSNRPIATAVPTATANQAAKLIISTAFS